MSESDSPISIPSDAALREALRHAVAEVYGSGNMGELTVRRIRAAAEQELGLPGGFFKGDCRWKGESDRIIKDETDAQEAGATSSPAAKPQAPPIRKTKREPANKRTRRPAPDDTAQPRKRQKTATPVDSESGESALSSLDETFNGVPAKDKLSPRTKKPRGRLSEDEKTVPTLKSKKNGRPRKTPSVAEENVMSVALEANGESRNAGSESDMSEVLDEAPPPKKKGQKASGTSVKDKKSAKSKPKEAAHVDPQEAEIKRLQSWLLKCGIRKLWHKELAPYNSSKAKIYHLRSMLKDAGMDGRFSVEKAKQIKEERELQAELEAVQEGAKQWGEPAVTEDDAKRPNRRLAKGLRELDFLGDDDGEETD